MPPARTRTLACPNCGGSIAIRANGLSVSAVCASCGSVVDVTNPDVKLIGEAQARTRQPLIALGTRARLAGTLWEVVGFQTRSDVVEGWSWDEYLLFSPYEGFRFLVQDEENWTLYAMLPQDVPDPAAGAADGRHYRLLSESRARTDYVLGEFYWRVRVGDEVGVAEYGDSPYLLSRETGADEVTWSRGMQLTGAMVTAAFKLSPAAVAPTLFEAVAGRRADTWSVVWISLAALGLLMLLAMIPFGRSQSAVVFSQRFATSIADKGRPVVTPDFTVPEAGGNLRIDVSAPMRNAWLELGLSLVNVATQQSFDADVTVEEYEGTDSDGAWTEGGQTAAASFARVPGGVYRLLIDTDALAYGQRSRTAASNSASVSFSVVVRRHVPSAGIFWLTALLLVIYPVWRWIAGRYLRARAEGTRG